ncbi:MAG: hypothetical protein HZB80_01850 [Deltaproteobacteria bacterium]|nr:hypothetical protein [Deltaproteobacteria bacterium]
MNQGALPIGFNGRYLLDFLGRIEAGRVKMIFKSSVTPCEITPLEEPISYRYIVMPMVIK